MELFAGFALVTAIAFAMGFPVGNPIDINIGGDRHDLLDPKVRQQIGEYIDDMDPFLLLAGPVCGPWSPWQQLNMSRSEDTANMIRHKRKIWYPVIKWVFEIFESRIKRGRHILCENPWPSLLWGLKCVDDFMSTRPYHADTDEPVELVKIDQCMYGLCDQDNGLPHRKSTGLLLSSKWMKKRLNRLCDQGHQHQPLEGGQRTQMAEHWPKDLCRQMVEGCVDELLYGTLHLAFAIELEHEQRQEQGLLDAVRSEHDLAPPFKKQRTEELVRAEDMQEEPIVDDLVMKEEAHRRQQWLKLPREKRMAIRRLHNMTGHCSTAALHRMLKASGVEQQVLQGVKFFQCQVCRELAAEEAPRVTRAMRPSFQQQFNYELSCDVFEIHDSEGHRHSILSLVDTATHFHVAARVAGGGTPTSNACAQAINITWLSWAGAPTFFVADQGVHNRGKVAHLLTIQGTVIRQTAARAPHQLGVGERHGGLLKQVMKRAVHERRIHGASDISALCSEAAKIKNQFVNVSGYSPSQWVMGRMADDVTSLMSYNFDEHLGTHQAVVDAEFDEYGSQDVFARQLLIRQWAKEAFMQADSSQRIRRALLRKSKPMRGPYRAGDLVSFNKKGKWYGPARVLANEGKASLWLLHAGVTVLVAETSCRPATTEEVIKRQVLDMRPSRKRKRQILLEQEDDEELPFADDYLQDQYLQGGSDGQMPYVDLQGPDEPETPVLPGGTGVAANPEDEMSAGEEHLPLPVPSSMPENDEPALEPMEPETPVLQHPPGLEGQSMTGQSSGLLRSTSTISTSSQPEPETPPVTSVSNIEQGHSMPSSLAPTATPLTQALRRDPDMLDGSFPNRRPHASSDAFLAGKSEKKYKKKTQKAGAGRELCFVKETPEMQKKLIVTRTKEWSNWEKYSDGRLVSNGELAKMIRENPNIKIIPMRWVDTNKAEINEPEWLKSRLVVRGDLEDSSRMRTDSPTCSQTMFSMVIILAACRNTSLWSGDISAAFLQGSKLDRLLVLRLPHDGVPGVDGYQHYVVSSTVYGTKDAPRGWFKNLDGTVKKHGLKPVPYEPASYTLVHPDGSLAGLLVCHVDDLMWTGGSYMEECMKKICDHYNFGKVEKDNFKYCGRNITRDEKAIYVKCEKLVDRVRPIFIPPEMKKKEDVLVNENLKGQLRSVVGSLAWLVRVCRPDLAYAVCKLQMSVHAATIGDVKYANSIISLAQKTKDFGLTYPICAFQFEDLMIVAIQDASHAADFDVSLSGEKLGHRSQSGRLLCVADKSFEQSRTGHLLIVEWHSTVIKRVCRSTMQAETLSLLSGAEEAEHLRYVVHGLYEPHPEQAGWELRALDGVMVDWYTDCRSLRDHTTQAGLHTVTDKRLAIDLCGLRQQIWRVPGELHGDPLLTDRLAENSTTKIKWTTTDRMLADPLTKGMKHEGLRSLMDGEAMNLKPTGSMAEKDNGCENEGVIPH